MDDMAMRARLAAWLQGVYEDHGWATHSAKCLTAVKNLTNYDSFCLGRIANGIRLITCKLG
jgi:hypothetical protein